MIELLNGYDDTATQQLLVERIESYYAEARELMPELPEDLKIYFSKDVIDPETGVGGFSYDHDIITIGFDETIQDRNSQFLILRGVVFHEAFHRAHRYHAQQPKISALHEAVYEGAATVFERDYGGRKFKPYSDDAQMTEWLAEVAQLGTEFDWYKWKVYDEETKRPSILYQVGAYLIDHTLTASGLTILDLRHKSAAEIISMSGIKPVQ